MAKVTLRFDDGETVVFETAAGETILGAAYRAGVPLAKDCEIGDCQTCRATLLSGDISIDELAYITLEDDEIAEGAILNCISTAETDVEIAIPYSRASLIPVRSTAMEVTTIERLAPTTVALRGRLPPAEALPFHPGQYVNITVPGGGAQRSFSMANKPEDAGSLEFLVRILPSGAMSDYLRNGAAQGDKLTISGPHGVFYLRPGTGPILMVAGGTGIAPMASMLRHLIAQDMTARPLTLCFGVNTEDDLFYVDELEALGQSLPDFSLRVAVVEPGAAWTGARGFVTDLLQPGDVGAATQVYLCGPPPMVDAARAWLDSHGVDRERVFAEEFQPSGV